jgi:cation-transporting ATPase 13A1
MAGKLNAALFDKTGTLTTDELVAVGVLSSENLKFKDENLLTPMVQVRKEAALVLAGCHSLVHIEGETTGDPLESASLKAMRWQLSSGTGNAIPAPETEKKKGGKAIQLSSSGKKLSDIQVVTRHHFSSKLQRMSCVISANNEHFAVMKGSPEAVGNHLAKKPDGYDQKAATLSKKGYRVIALAYKPLSSNKSIEDARDTRSSCEAGMQFAGFIAFTCRVRKDTAAVLNRLQEGGMSIAMVTGDALLTAVHVAKEVNIFEPVGGFQAERERPEETNPELKKLLESKQSRGKKTEEKMKKKDFKPILLLEVSKGGKLYWKSYDNDEHIVDYTAENVSSLSNEYGLATTGKSLALALEIDEKTSQVLGYFKVFARMTPDAKETVIECLHSVGSLCLMCGDGANDVGALKGADVGVALLSGFGDINVEKEAETTQEDTQKEIEQSKLTAIMSPEKLNEIRQFPVALIKMKIRQLGVEPNKYPELIEKEDLVQLYQIKARELAIKRHDTKNAKDKKNMSRAELRAQTAKENQERQEKVMRRAAELEARGVAWASVKAMKQVMAEEMEIQRKKKGIVKGGGIENSASALASQLEDVESGELPMVKLGDASIAAPFTSKMPSIRSCVDIVRQGRCTLVSSIQQVSVCVCVVFHHFKRSLYFTFFLQYQIMALQCLISSYSLSALYLDGVKYGDTQMTAMGMLGVSLVLF